MKKKNVHAKKRKHLLTKYTFLFQNLWKHQVSTKLICDCSRGDGVNLSSKTLSHSVYSLWLTEDHSNDKKLMTDKQRSRSAICTLTFRCTFELSKFVSPFVSVRNILRRGLKRGCSTASQCHSFARLGSLSHKVVYLRRETRLMRWREDTERRRLTLCWDRMLETTNEGGLRTLNEPWQQPEKHVNCSEGADASEY